MNQNYLIKVFFVITFFVSILTIFIILFYFFVLTPKTYILYSYISDDLHFSFEQKQKAIYSTFNFLSGNDANTYNFTEREIRHLNDLKKLYEFAQNMFALLILLAVTLIVIAFKIQPDMFTKIYKKFLRFFYVFAVLSLFFIVFFFEKLFIFFHKVTFNNTDWLLDPQTEVLFSAFPPDVFFAIIISTILLGVSITELTVFFFKTKVKV